MRPLLLIALGLSGLLPTPATAQGSRADYERAAQLRSRFDGLLDDPRVQVQWDPGGQHAVVLSQHAPRVRVVDLGDGTVREVEDAGNPAGE